MTADGDAIDDDRAHSDVCRIADAALAGDVRAGKNTDMVADHGMVPDQRTTVEKHVAADRGVHPDDYANADYRPFTERASRGDSGRWMHESRESNAERRGLIGKAASVSCSQGADGSVTVTKIAKRTDPYYRQALEGLVAS